MIAIGNEELGEPVEKGDLVICPNCGKPHPLKYGTNDVMGFIHCTNGPIYLASLGGKLVPKVRKA